MLLSGTIASPLQPKSFHTSKLSPCFLLNKNGRNFNFRLTVAERKVDQKPKGTGLFVPLRISKVLLVRSVVAIFGLGFIDAGYSGDWSRIGVISKETEELLKIAAYLVIPLCLFVIFFISEETRNSN